MIVIKTANMMKIIFMPVLLTLIYGALQASAQPKSNSYDSIIQQFKSEIDSLKIQIDGIQKDLFYKTDSVKYEIENKVKTSSNRLQRNINDKQLELQYDLRYLSVDKKDMEECLQNNLNYLEANITTQNISFCYPSAEFSLLSEMQKTLKQHQADLSSLIYVCTTYSSTEQSVIRCFGEQLAQTRYTVNSINEEMLVMIEKAKPEAEACISEATKQILKQLDSLKCEATVPPTTSTTETATTTENHSTIDPNDITSSCNCVCKRPIKKFKCELVP